MGSPGGWLATAEVGTKKERLFGRLRRNPQGLFPRDKGTRVTREFHGGPL